MKAQEHRIDILQFDRFEADIGKGIDALFRRCPTLCGFAVRDADSLAREGIALQHVSELFITEVSVYPQTGLDAPAEVCNEIAATLVELIDQCPAACAMLGERTFARVVH